MITSPVRINQLLGYQWKLKELTFHEKKFLELLKKAIIDSRPWDKDILIDCQKIFTDGKIAYIADIYIEKYNIVYEIDGMQHEQNKEYDEKRRKFLRFFFDIRCERFKNSELSDPDIMKRIINSLGKKKIPSSSLYKHLTLKERNRIKKVAKEETKIIDFYSAIKENNPAYLIPIKKKVM